MPSIVVERDRGCYIVYVNGEFWSTCESMAEVAEEMADIRDRHKVEG